MAPDTYRERMAHATRTLCQKHCVDIVIGLIMAMIFG
jgi:hypothetical protein